MPPRYWQILPAVVAGFCTVAAAAQPYSPGLQAVAGWTECVVEAGKRFAAGPDSADFVISAALLACPQERAEALKRLQSEYPGLPSDPLRARLQYQIEAAQQMESFARNQIMLAVAEFRAKQPAHK